MIKYNAIPVQVEIEHIADPVAIINWIAGVNEKVNQRIPDDMTFLLAFSEDGVTWGRSENGRWLLSCNEFPAVSPPIDMKHLHWVRIFGNSAEILIWKDDGKLHGRIATDKQDSEVPDWLEPKDESVLLKGTFVTEIAPTGFSLLYSKNGSRQAVPLQFKQSQYKLTLKERPRLLVRHYFAQDEETGAVKRIMTRLMNLKGGN